MSQVIVSWLLLNLGLNFYNKWAFTPAEDPSMLGHPTLRPHSRTTLTDLHINTSRRAHPCQALRIQASPSPSSTRYGTWCVAPASTPSTTRKHTHSTGVPLSRRHFYTVIRP